MNFREDTKEVTMTLSKTSLDNSVTAVALFLSSSLFEDSLCSHSRVCLFGKTAVTLVSLPPCLSTADTTTITTVDTLAETERQSTLKKQDDNHSQEVVWSTSSLCYHIKSAVYSFFPFLTLEFSHRLFIRLLMFYRFVKSLREE